MGQFFDLAKLLPHEFPSSDEDSMGLTLEG
jgi:hypothetical protein